MKDEGSAGQKPKPSILGALPKIVASVGRAAGAALLSSATPEEIIVWVRGFGIEPAPETIRKHADRLRAVAGQLDMAAMVLEAYRAQGGDGGTG